MTEVIATSARSDFRHDLYNSTPDVQNADADIRRDGSLERALTVLAPIFQAFDVAEFCGINLLHKHWTVEESEIPLQSRQPYASGHELVTTPSLAGTTAMPSSWVLLVEGTRADFVPFEFSTDAEVLRHAEHLMRLPAFFATVGDALLAHDLFRHFGVCIVPREPLSDDPDASLVEVSSPRARASLIRAASLNPGQPYIQTAWIFAIDDKKQPPKPVCRPGVHCEVEEVPVGPPYHYKSKDHDPD
ncbi:MAG: hypothetical protein AB1586_00340 [Pseudomonadota bacterium]